MSKHISRTKRSLFGLVALIVAIISVIFLGVFFGVSQLNITPATFSTLNKLTALIYCVTAPIAFILGIAGYRADSKKLSLIAMGLVGVPFLILFGQFVWSLLR